MGNRKRTFCRTDELKTFFGDLKNFAFYAELEKLGSKPVEQRPPLEVLNQLLTEEGLNYGNLPKGLLLFHRL